MCREALRTARTSCWEKECSLVYELLTTPGENPFHAERDAVVKNGMYRIGDACAWCLILMVYSSVFFGRANSLIRFQHHKI